MGTGITLINNVGNVVVSLGKEGVGFYVIMISVGSTLGRAGAGFLRLGMVWPPIIAAAAQLILSSSSWYALSFGCFFTGVGFGASFTLQPCCLAEVFGTKDFGKILGLSMFAPSVGSILLSVVMATFIYDIHIPPGGEVSLLLLAVLLAPDLALLLAGMHGTELLQIHLLDLSGPEHCLRAAGESF